MFKKLLLFILCFLPFSELVNAGNIDNNTLSYTGAISGSIRENKFSADGLTLYETESSGVSQYLLTGAYDPTTKTFDHKESKSSPSVAGMAFNDDGTRVYYLRTNNYINEYTLSTPYDIGSTDTFVVNYDLTSASGLSNASAIYFGSGGLSLFTTSVSGTAYIAKFTMTSAYDISTISYDSKTVLTSQLMPLYNFSLYGTDLFTVTNNSTSNMKHYSLNGIDDISTVTYNSGVTLPGTSSIGVRGIFFEPSNSRFYYSGGSSVNTLYVYDSDFQGSTAPLCTVETDDCQCTTEFNNYPYISDVSYASGATVNEFSTGSLYGSLEYDFGGLAQYSISITNADNLANFSTGTLANSGSGFTFDSTLLTIPYLQISSLASINGFTVSGTGSNDFKGYDCDIYSSPDFSDTDVGYINGGQVLSYGVTYTLYPGIYNLCFAFESSFFNNNTITNISFGELTDQFLEDTICYNTDTGIYTVDGIETSSGALATLGDYGTDITGISPNSDLLLDTSSGSVLYSGSCKVDPAYNIGFQIGGGTLFGYDLPSAEPFNNFTCFFSVIGGILTVPDDTSFLNISSSGASYTPTVDFTAGSYSGFGSYKFGDMMILIIFALGLVSYFGYSSVDNSYNREVGKEAKTNKKNFVKGRKAFRKSHGGKNKEDL